MLRRRTLRVVAALLLSMPLLASCWHSEAPPPPRSDVPASEFWVPVAQFWPNDRNHADTLRDMWPVVFGTIEIRPGLDLVTRKCRYDTLYFVRRGTVGRLLAALINDAEIESVTPDVVRLRCHMSADGFQGFPTQIIYYVDRDERIEAPLYLDCTQPFRFNYYVKKDEHQPPPLTGHEVLDVRALDDTVTIRFGPPASDPARMRTPETVTVFDEGTSIFSLFFIGSKATQDVVGKTAELSDTAACQSLSLAQTPEGVQLDIGLTQPMEYRIDYVSGGQMSMTVCLRSK